jgi:dihydrodipicolinate synthase/N-acetylneuraminate lyase
VSPNGELSRLVTAAVVNQRFCNLLLSSPMVALAAGYNGESFHLTLEERELVVSIRASSLTDFATQLTGNGHNRPSCRL